MKTTIVKVTKQRYNVYIGRPSKWGNPFRITKNCSREECLKKYKEYILNNPKLLSELIELKGKVLGCSCKPMPCHGDILIELIKELKI